MRARTIVLVEVLEEIMAAAAGILGWRTLEKHNHQP